MRAPAAGVIGLILMLAGTGGSAATADSECKCRAPAGLFSLGEETCLQTSEGPRKATCVMVLNNTSWRIDTRPCGISRRVGGPTPG